MSTKSSDLSDLLDQVNKLEIELPNAQSRESALEIALSAAELSLKGLKLSRDPATTKSINTKVKSWLEKAERIKFSNQWKPQAKTTSIVRRASQDQFDVTKIAKLQEPVSSRKVPTSEAILLLKASQLNGFKFPPWKDGPSNNDFALPDDGTPFVDKAELRLSALQLEVFVGWKRAAEALPPPAWHLADTEGTEMTMHSSRTVDLVQDAATDCSVVASLCAVVAREERGHAKILSSVMYPYDAETSCPVVSPNGKYVFKLNFNGTYRKVEIDDRLPVSKSSRVLHVIDRRNPGLLWPALLEKAYLKVRGSYDFPGSNSGTDLWILSGWIPEQIFLQSDDTEPNVAWDRIHNAHQYGDVLVTMGTGKISNKTEREIGLAGEHDYAVLDMREIDGQKLMLIKNPWCEGTSWKGSIPKVKSTPSADRVDEMDDEIIVSSRDLLNSDHDLTPGTFWMDLNSIVQYFESIYLNWNPGLFSHRQDMHFPWDLSGPSPRGKNRSFASHPQLILSVKEPGTAWVLLNRHFRDTDPVKEGHTTGYIGLYAFDSNGAKVYLGDGALHRGIFVDSPQTLLRLDDLEAGKMYTIVPVEQDLAATMQTFTLSVFSNSKISISEAVNRYPNEKVVSASWTDETAGGNAHSPTYSRNPQFRITVGKRTPIALLLETSIEHLNLHVKLVHGKGQRVQAIRSRDIVFDSKDYRRGCALAQFTDLDPGTYTIICSTFEAGQKGDFTLRVNSVAATHLSLLPREGAGRLRKMLAKAAFRGQQQMIAAPLDPHRLTKLDFLVKQLAQGPSVRISDHGQPRERSMVRVTVETGRGPTRRILVASSGGDYSDAIAGVRTGELDLATQQVSIWLVIERMFTPRDLPDEEFQVEMFTDTPDALTVGVWREWAALD